MNRRFGRCPAGACVALVVLTGCIHFPSTPDITARPPREPGSVLIHDVRVFTGTAVAEHMDVRFADGLITDVVPTGSALQADQVVDGAGRTVMPGLVDLHVHLALQAGPPWFLTVPAAAHAAQSYVYAGITTVLDVAGEVKVIRGLQDPIAAGRWVGPRIYFAGPGLTVEGGYPLDMMRDVYGALAFASTNGHHVIAVKDVAQIEAEVDAVADAGGTFIKLMAASIPPSDPPAPRLSEELVRAATVRAHARGLRVAAHIDTSADALLCARAGVDLLAHGIETSRVTDEEIATLRASGISFEPTLVNWARFDQLVGLDFQPTRSERETQPRAVLESFSPQALRKHEAVLTESSFKSWGDALTAHREDRITNTTAMFLGGVPLRVGSDSGGSIGTFPGSLHDELRLLVEAGVPVLTVLAAATHGNAEFLDPNARFGLVQPGYRADLVLVEGDPTTDIRHTEDILQVYVGGSPVRRRSLD